VDIAPFTERRAFALPRRRLQAWRPALPASTQPPSGL